VEQLLFLTYRSREFVWAAAFWQQVVVICPLYGNA